MIVQRQGFFAPLSKISQRGIVNSLSCQRPPRRQILRRIQSPARRFLAPASRFLFLQVHLSRKNPRPAKGERDIVDERCDSMIPFDSQRDTHSRSLPVKWKTRVSCRCLGGRSWCDTVFPGVCGSDRTQRRWRVVRYCGAWVLAMKGIAWSRYVNEVAARSGALHLRLNCEWLNPCYLFGWSEAMGLTKTPLPARTACPPPMAQKRNR